MYYLLLASASHTPSSFYADVSPQQEGLFISRVPLGWEEPTFLPQYLIGPEKPCVSLPCLYQAHIQTTSIFSLLPLPLWVTATQPPPSDSPSKMQLSQQPAGTGDPVSSCCSTPVILGSHLMELRRGWSTELSSKSTSQ